MAKYEFLKDMLVTFRQLFSGNYNALEIEDSTSFAAKIPTLSDDRKNLKHDRALVAEDFQKALRKKNTELSHQ